MKNSDPIEERLSGQRVAPPSPELRDRVLQAAQEAWETPERSGDGDEKLLPFPAISQAPWWQAAAAGLILFAGLNAIQSAGNLEAARGFPAAPSAGLTDAEARLLAEGLDGFAASDLKRIAFLSSQRDHLLKLPGSVR